MNQQNYKLYNSSAEFPIKV